MQLASRVRDEFSAWTLGRRGVSGVFDPFWDFLYCFSVFVSANRLLCRWQSLVTILYLL
jgi:hypothetical protein